MSKTKNVTLKDLIHTIVALDAEGQAYARIVIHAVGTLDDPREMHSALLSSVAYELPKRMLKRAFRVESVLAGAA